MLNQHSIYYKKGCMVSSSGVYFCQFGSLLSQKNIQLGAKNRLGTYSKRRERERLWQGQF